MVPARCCPGPRASCRRGRDPPPACCACGASVPCLLNIRERSSRSLTASSARAQSPAAGRGDLAGRANHPQDPAGSRPGLAQPLQNGSASSAGAGLVVPGVGRVGALGLVRWFGRLGRVGRLGGRSLSGGRRDSRAGCVRSGCRGTASRRRRWLARGYWLSGYWLSGRWLSGHWLSGGRPPGIVSLARIRHGDISRVVPQGRPDYLPAPLGAGPSGELGPRQDFVYLRGLSLGDVEANGNPGWIWQPGMLHGFKVPTNTRESAGRHPVASGGGA